MNNNTDISFNVKADEEVSSSEAFALSYGTMASSIVDSVSRVLEEEYY